MLGFSVYVHGLPVKPEALFDPSLLQIDVSEGGDMIGLLDVKAVFTTLFDSALEIGNGAVYILQCTVDGAENVQSVGLFDQQTTAWPVAGNPLRQLQCLLQMVARALI